MKHVVLILISFLSLEKVNAQPENTTNSNYDSLQSQNLKSAFPLIKKLYTEYAIKNNIPAISFGIVNSRGLIFSGGIGVINLATGAPTNEHSVFRIASMTKSFTAMAILKLRDSGLLNLDDPVIRYIPELKNTLLPSNAKQITIRNLLTHTAGFPEDNPWADRQLEMTDEELVLFISKGMSMAYNPGERYEYSNLGYAILGHLISKLSHQSFESYITENILRPLNMSSTFWEYEKVPKDQLVSGYSFIDGTLKRETLLHSGIMGASGGLLTSVEDFSKYIRLHLSPWTNLKNFNNSPVSKTTIREMHNQGLHTRLRKKQSDRNSSCPTIVSYNDGLVWSKDCSEKITIQHSGGLPGFGSNWIFVPEYDLALVTFTNLTYASAADLNELIIDTLIKIAKLQPLKIPVSDILEKRKNELVQIIPHWNIDKANNPFSQVFFQDNMIEDLRKEAKDLFLRAGRITGVSEIYPVNRLRGYFTLKGEKKSLDIWFTLSPENPPLIQEYKISLHD